MTTPTFNWQVISMSCKPQSEKETNVVVLASWQCTGNVSVNQDVVTSTYSGVTPFTYTPGNPFTPFADLTQDQVLGWIWEQVSKEETETQVAKQIDNQINPPVISPPLPWSN